MNDDYFFDVKKKRPEEIYKNSSDYFKGDRLVKYALSKNIQKIQMKITKRAMEILNLKNKDALILDAGCGPGFASFYLKNYNYKVVAYDIISEFLYFYDLKDINPIVGDLCLLPFKPKTFNGIISISALQWIYRDINDKNMIQNFTQLISTLYKILKYDSKVIFQFYPKNDLILKHMKEIIIRKTKFKGGFLIDNPNNPKKRKIFLILKKKNNLK